MSTCPTKDIHSLYLDNEMPEIYKNEYESHLQNCPKCREKLERLKALRALLHSDSEPEMTESALDESFERLQMKMKYSKNVGRAESNSSARFRYFIPAAAAAALVAVILPVSFRKGLVNENSNVDNSVVESAIKSAAQTQNVAFGSGRNVVISGNIHESVIPQTVGEATSLVHNVNGNSVKNSGFMQNVEVFRPPFAERNTKSIRITVPDMNTIPVTVEIEFPDTVRQVSTSEFDQ